MSAYEHGAPIVIERITLRRVAPRLGYATIRMPGVNLSGLKVEERPDGRLTLTAPAREDRDGRQWAYWALQPGYKEAAEREIACLWARSS